jgi:hypothetical protein
MSLSVIDIDFIENAKYVAGHGFDDSTGTTAQRLRKCGTWKGTWLERSAAGTDSEYSDAEREMFLRAAEMIESSIVADLSREIDEIGKKTEGYEDGGTGTRIWPRNGEIIVTDGNEVRRYTGSEKIGDIRKFAAEWVDAAITDDDVNGDD